MVSIAQVSRVDGVPRGCAFHRACTSARWAAVGGVRARALVHAPALEILALAGLKDTSNAKPVRAQLPVCCAVRAR